MTDFRNRKVLITGAASGIGHLLALRIAARGGRLILWDVDAAHLAAVAAEIVAAGGQAADNAVAGQAETWAKRIVGKFGGGHARENARPCRGVNLRQPGEAYS